MIDNAYTRTYELGRNAGQQLERLRIRTLLTKLAEVTEDKEQRQVIEVVLKAVDDVK